MDQSIQAEFAITTPDSTRNLPRPPTDKESLQRASSLSPLGSATLPKHDWDESPYRKIPSEPQKVLPALPKIDPQLNKLTARETVASRNHAAATLRDKEFKLVTAQRATTPEEMLAKIKWGLSFYNREDFEELLDKAPNAMTRTLLRKCFAEVLTRRRQKR